MRRFYKLEKKKKTKNPLFLVFFFQFIDLVNLKILPHITETEILREKFFMKVCCGFGWDRVNFLEFWI